ncbi:hypothetical protein ACWAUC_29290 [Bradyrhizobium guangdongense]
MRYIYMDEAGTSAKEPVSVVVGIILHADRQYVNAEARLDEALKLVPTELQDWSGPGSGGLFFWHPKRFKPNCRFLPVWNVQFESR